ncbi:MAG TPA: 4-hydroxythreonine-4-phosphate dehydrogenase PdxA, partial [Nitrospiria bacterium]|nr:4-hydroxythreonine-4-phosphate dehydrogenase PdxA [Nitrospiria bacterium]
QQVHSPPSPGTDFGPERLFLLPAAQNETLSKNNFRFGIPLPENGKAAGMAIEKGAALALKGEIDAITTAPINKETLQMAGYSWPGHTEFLAALSGVSDFGMMIAGGPLKVVFVTIHEAVSNVPALIKKERVLKTILLACREMRNLFGISAPRIAVASLNPHGGENGLFGEEEAREILPAVAAARDAGHHVTGPLSPDTLFYKCYHGEYDAVVVMYHDQGLIPLKMIAFKKSVNLTLGLPFIRTSVDHGTAYDIAGQGVADPGSLREALLLAASLVGKRKNISS